MNSRLDSPASLRDQAETARRHAKRLWPHPAADELLAYAKELYERADRLERVAVQGRRQPQHCSAERAGGAEVTFARIADVTTSAGASR